MRFAQIRFYHVPFLYVSVICKIPGLSHTMCKYLLPFQRTEHQEGRYHYMCIDFMFIVTLTIYVQNFLNSSYCIFPDIYTVRNKI